MSSLELRRPAAASLLGAAAAFAGLIGVVSALTPELAARSDLVEGILPPGVPAAARVLALSFGVGLIWLARALARRQRRAWILAVALVAGSAAAHLAKGLDVEEASISLALLAALWHERGRFDAPGDPATVKPLVRVALALSALGVVGLLQLLDVVPFGDRPEDALAVIAGALSVRGLYLCLRPHVERVRQSAAARARAEQLVHTHGADSLAPFSLRRDRSYFFSRSGHSFLAYRVVGGSALVTGEPIGEAGEREELLRDFHSVAVSKAWRVALLGADAASLPFYRALGFKPLYLGDEAILRPERFSLEGRRMRKVRQSVARLHRAGYRARVVGVDEVDGRLRRQLEEVSREWRGRRPERGFAMAMDSLFGHPEGLFALAETEGGDLGGFIHLVPAPASGGLSLAAMRRRPSSPNGLMEFLVAETASWSADRGVAELSLNFAVWGEILRGDRSARLLSRVLKHALVHLDRVFQLERLHSFNRKFLPEWRPRYVLVERWADLPPVGLAYLRAESLLTPPGPWARMADLAAR